MPLIFGALSEVLPRQVQADVGMMNIFHVAGRHRDGREVASLCYMAGGFGAMSGLDGAATTPGPSNMGVVPTEMWENRTSMTIERRELLADSGGAGQFRGGVGQQVVMRNDTGHPLTMSFMGQRTEFPARGFDGGKPGLVRRYRINGEVVHPKGRYQLAPGDVVILDEAGGGGFGDPRRRPVEAIIDDVRRGFVSIEGALRDFGSVVDGRNWTP